MFRDELLQRRLSWEEAKDLAGTSFDVFPDEAGSDTVRVEIVEVRNRHSTPSMIQFSLVLRGPASPLLLQRTYRLRHATLGEFAFLITAIGRTDEAVSYEACFSHAP
jgi:hypothetical protein